MLLSLLLVASGFELDLSQVEPQAESELGASDLEAAKADLAAGRFGAALARASQITGGGLRGTVAAEAAVVQALAAVQLQLPRLAVLLVAEHLSEAPRAARDELLVALGPLFESPVTAPELARALRGVPAEGIPSRWRPYYGYYASRAVLAARVAKAEADSAPRQRRRGGGREIAQGSALQLEDGGLDTADGAEPAGEGGEDEAARRSAAATAKIAAAEAAGAAKRTEVVEEAPVDDLAKVLAQARSLLGLVPKGHILYPKAQLQAGIIATMDSDDESALSHFRSAQKHGDSRVAAVAIMQLARVHYAHGQMRTALTFYRQVPPSSPDWPRALFEQAWAQFRRGDFGRVLGILEAFASPFLSDEIIEEIEVLRALSYYENCRYDEAIAAAKRVLDKRDAYLSLSAALEEMGSGKEWLSLFLRRQQLRDEALRRRLMQLAMQPAIGRSVAIFEGAESEYGRLLGAGLQPSDLRRLEKVFRDRFSVLREQVGQLIRSAMVSQRVTLAELLKSALALQVEIEEQLTKVLQQELRGGTGGVIAMPSGAPVSVSDDYVWWPFEGEYWRDELETYEVHLGMTCR